MKICKTILMALVFCIGISTVLTVTSVIAIASEVVKTDEDKTVIPDKYNTKAKTPTGGFKKIVSGSTLEAGKEFTLKGAPEGAPTTIRLQESVNQSTSKVENKINLQYANKNLTGTVVFENVDFSATMTNFTVLSESARNETELPIKFVFKNCVFKSFGCSREEQPYVSFEFTNCTFENFFGSNAVFDRCYFGGGIGDRIVPFCMDTFNNCYIANPTSNYAADGEIHVDGTQIYGWSTTEAYEIHFKGCRFELPALSFQNAPKTYVNACIMLQLEYNNAHDLSFTDCYVNGGGYAVYAHSKYDEQTFENTYFENLKFGCCLRWGKLYPHKGTEIEFNQETWTDASSIYVGTVNRDKTAGVTTLSVTNDSNQARTFRAYTSSGKYYDFKIAACPLGKEISGMKFEDFPFDVQYKIPEYCEWVVCYDITDALDAAEGDGESKTGDINTMGNLYKQVRYVNWGKKTLVFCKNSKGKMVVRERNVVKSVALDKTTYIYNGLTKKPKVILKYSDGDTIPSKNYKITYVNNKNVGQASVKIEMLGNFKGTYTKKFIINPSGTVINKLNKKVESKVVNGKTIKSTFLVVAYKAKKIQTSGYQIQYSTDSKFAVSKICTITNCQVASRSISSLKSGKTYYVRIRTYKKVKIDGKEKKLYSAWSEVKKIKM